MNDHSAFDRTLPPTGLDIPLRATFGGPAAVPWLALGHNSFNPLLRLREDGIEYRLFRRRTRPYSDIVEVGVVTAIGTRNLKFRWRDSAFMFTANVSDDASRLKALGWLARRGVALSESARRLLTVVETEKA